MRTSTTLRTLALAASTLATLAACSGREGTIDDGVTGANGSQVTASTTSPRTSGVDGGEGAEPGDTTTGDDAGATTVATQGAADASTSGNGDDDATPDAGSPAPAATTDAGGTTKDSGASTPVSTSHHPTTTAPTRTCGYSEDSNGFQAMSESSGTYYVHLPSGYDKTKPYPVLIGSHGCGDTAEHFGTWAMDPYNDGKNGFQSDLQKYIAVSVEDVASGCWNIADGSKIIAALDDVATCFYVDQAHVTIGGYSSGAGAAYSVGLANAQRFAGILIEDGALYDTGSNEASLLANAAWKINIAHMAHNQDPDYTLSSVEADWTKIKAAGFPLVEMTEDGDHNGTYQDWANLLIPKVTAWSAP